MWAVRSRLSSRFVRAGRARAVPAARTVAAGLLRMSTPVPTPAAVGSVRWLSAVTPTPTRTPTPNPTTSASAPASAPASASETPEEARAEQKAEPRPVTWSTLIVSGLLIGGFALYYEYDKKQRAARFTKSGARTIGTPELGGPFDLIDANGARVTDSDLIGQYFLIYFGFTNCPDVCPTELKKMERALTALDADGVAKAEGGIRPVFVSIDPKRDTPTRLKQYAAEWHPRTLWLTGSDEQISRIAKSYRIYWSIPPNPSEQYLVDHSIFFFLMDRNGKYMDFFGKNTTADEVVVRVKKLIAADREKPFVPRPRTEPPPPPPITKPKFNAPNVTVAVTSAPPSSALKA